MDILGTSHGEIGMQHEHELTEFFNDVLRDADAKIVSSPQADFDDVLEQIAENTRRTKEQLREGLKTVRLHREIRKGQWEERSLRLSAPGHTGPFPFPHGCHWYIEMCFPVPWKPWVWVCIELELPCEIEWPKP